MSSRLVHLSVLSTLILALGGAVGAHAQEHVSSSLPALRTGDVELLLADMDAAVWSLDIDATAQTLAPGAVIEFTVLGRDRACRQTRAQYLYGVQQTWRELSEYAYERGPAEITIAPTGQTAEARYSTRQYINIEGQSFAVRTQTVARVRQTRAGPVIFWIRSVGEPIN